MPLSVIIEGRNGFGSWGGHLRRWNPLTRPSTLLLRYEDMVRDTRGVVDALADYLKLTPKSYDVPSRDQMAKRDGKWIRSEAAPRLKLDGADLDRFWEINGEAMHNYGYARLAGRSAPAGLR